MRSGWAIAWAVAVLPAQAWGLAPKDVYKKAAPAVVLVMASDSGKNGNAGTGSIITPEGKVITNAHVVISETGRPYKKVYVWLKPAKVTGDVGKDLRRRFRAEVVAFSPKEELDLALLQIQEPPKKLPTLRFADPNEVEVGDAVVAIGHPEQGGLWTLTTGTISTVIASFNSIEGNDVFQTEASINRGNSGGPLLDSDGHMVGINTSIARRGRGGVAITDVNFSVKSSVAVRWLAGRGLGLAYAKPGDGTAAAVVALAPEAPTPKAKAGSAPASTIVVTEAQPKEPKQVRQEGLKLGKKQAKETVTSGKRLDPKQAKPKFLTPRRPFDLDALRRQQMRELESLMDEMRQHGSRRGGNTVMDDL